MSREGSGSLVIAFDDIERLSSSVRAHADFVRSRIGQVACAATTPISSRQFRSHRLPALRRRALWPWRWVDSSPMRP